MVSLLTTTARQIDKRTVTESKNLVINNSRQSHLSIAESDQVMKAGDFYFRPTLVQRTGKPTWWERLTRKSAQVKYESVDTIVISCPVCGLPILTTPAHRVVNKHPLTIDGQIACPYAAQGIAGSHSFSIKDGTIMPA